MVSFNAGGMCSRAGHDRFASELMYPQFAKSPDVVCLQETRWDVSMEKTVLQNFNYDAGFANNNEGSGGLAILFNRQLDYCVHAHKEFKINISSAAGASSQGFLIHCMIREREMVIVNVYLHTSSTNEERELFLARLGEEIVQFGCPNIICCGDFNVALDCQRDKITVNNRDHSHSRTFKEFIDIMEWGDSYRILNTLAHRMTFFSQYAAGGTDRTTFLFLGFS